MTTETTLRLTRMFKAPRERVFAAWTSPEAMKQWYCQCGGRHVCESIEVDCRVGGRIRVVLRNTADNERFAEVGVYKEIDPPNRLVCTFNWEDMDLDMPDTLLTVEFFDRDGGTEMRLTHEGFPNAAVCDSHREGWTLCFDELAETLANEPAAV